jgi:hypothetical protein
VSASASKTNNKRETDVKRKHLEFLEKQMNVCLETFDGTGGNPQWCPENLHKAMAKAAAAVYDACMDGQNYMLKMNKE